MIAPSVLLWTIGVPIIVAGLAIALAIVGLSEAVDELKEKE